MSKYGIANSYDDDLIKQYLSYTNSAIDAKQTAAQKALDTSKSQMYDAIGRAQLQNEQDIIKRRTQAQRSGATSSQLAAMEMQNMAVGQLGMQNIVSQFATEQAALETEYAGAKDEVMANAFQILNENVNNIAAVDAQRYAASSVEQMRELYPDATDAQLNVLARQYLGQDLSKSDKELISQVNTGYAFSEIATNLGVTNISAFETYVNGNTPVNFKTFANGALGDTRAGTFSKYEQYVEYYNKVHGTSYVAQKIRDNSSVDAVDVLTSSSLSSASSIPSTKVTQSAYLQDLAEALIKGFSH